ncbi:myrosinase 1 [Fopius arisanus]|uniref:beta-glucosidase n=1 Tax=Fopius arisanus TaxID=64838 RepID=A0A9R1TV44_9HYME|nr:PREDICTED: myrosinase 1-like [Fopius arisanus]
MRSKRNVVNGDSYLKIPAGFSIGAASSAFQVEGGWNASDKSMSNLDHIYRAGSKMVADTSCNSYYHWEEDVELMAEIKLQHYRFSLSWPRILPTASPENISEDGVKYYNNVIDALSSKGITPFVTIYHWDHPYILESFGGWANESMIDYFVDYARVVFREFGSKVRFWSTVNEPTEYSVIVGSSGANELVYSCVHNMLKAHAKVYHMYNEEFRKTQNGQIGIVAVSHYFYPSMQNDTEIARIAYEFHGGWTINPIFSKDGDYPAVMKQYVKTLPKFSSEWIDLIRGSSDYLGLNYYASYLSRRNPNKTSAKPAINFRNRHWPRAVNGWQSVHAKGFGDLLRFIKETYDNPPVYILENGIATDKSLYDLQREEYLYDHMKEMLLAINRDGCNVKAYTVWSLLDNFEWLQGYKFPYGLVSVDFNHPNRTRTLKWSALWLANTTTRGELVDKTSFDSYLL